tara:strand:- start:569 stop:1444 length:876 start_codon:yes stop_codon:yes gene_type:complete
MKVLITGALGYIGNEVLKRLTPKDIEIVALDNNSDSAERLLPRWIENKNFTYLHQDVCDLKPFDVDLIVHLAARVGYIECDNHPEDAARVNIGGTSAVAAFDKPTLHFSTGSVYGDIKSPCTESSKCNPQTLYSRTKHLSEEIIRAVPHCIVRPATAYGISYKTRHNLLFHTLIQLAAQKGEITLFQPDAVRTLYHVGKIADFVTYWVENHKIFENKTLNLGHPNCTVTKRGMVEMIAQHCDYKLEMVDGNDPDARDYEVDYRQLQSLWDNSHDDLSIHIENIIKYYKAWS